MNLALKFRKWIVQSSTRRAVVSLIVFILLWEIGSRSKIGRASCRERV